jgi:hypothetical protein
VSIDFPLLDISPLHERKSKQITIKAIVIFISPPRNCRILRPLLMLLVVICLPIDINETNSAYFLKSTRGITMLPISVALEQGCRLKNNCQ